MAGILTQLDALREREREAEQKINRAAGAMQLAQEELQRVQAEIRKLGFYPNYGRTGSAAPGDQRRV